jgi:uncharacterized Zn finger protein
MNLKCKWCGHTSTKEEVYSDMNLKCKDCGLVRTKKEAYTGKYALLNDDSIIMLSNMDKLRLACPVCGENTHHEVV